MDDSLYNGKIIMDNKNTYFVLTGNESFEDLKRLYNQLLVKQTQFHLETEKVLDEYYPISVTNKLLQS